MRHVRWSWLALVLACSSSTEGSGSSSGSQPQASRCAQRQGNYLSKYVQQTGNCGPLPDVVVQVDTQPTAPTPPCTGTIAYSNDNCDVTYDQTCPVDNVAPGAKLRSTGTSRWNADGSQGSATETWTITDADGSTLCQSTYGVAASRTDQAPSPAPTCLSAGQSCRGSSDACCNGTVCTFDANDPSKTACAATCLDDSQCNSGCCTTLIEGAAKVCAPAKYCASGCAAPGQSCSSTACCANAVCVESTVTGVTCAARCATHSQCAGGCCAPLSNTGELVCSPPTFCQ